jgi:Cu-Zn family superoxide dismutase
MVGRCYHLLLAGLTLTMVAGDIVAGNGAGAADATMQATLHKIDAQGAGEAVGTVRITQAQGGARFDIDLRGLPPGEHGFHVHQNGDCGPGPDPRGEVVAGGAAGPHWDPEDHKSHKGPEAAGHLGDLPIVRVGGDGTAKGATLASRVGDAARLRGKALMVHAAGDNYTDEPENGGSAGRIACGVIE